MTLKTCFTIGVCLVLLAVLSPMMAQTTTTTTTAPAAFSVGIGGGYNASGLNGAGSSKAAALLEFAYQPGTTTPAGSKIWLTADFLTQPGRSSGINTLRAGMGYSLVKSGNWNLIAIADAGGATTSTAVLGTVGGGLRPMYDLGGLVKSLAGIKVSGVFRIAAIAGTSVQPEYFAIVSKTFKGGQ